MEDGTTEGLAIVAEGHKTYENCLFLSNFGAAGGWQPFPSIIPAAALQVHFCCKIRIRYLTHTCVYLQTY